MVGFIFGGKTGETAESLARKRAVAQALLENANSRVPQSIGEGISALGQAVSGRLGLNALNKKEEAGRTAVSDRIRQALTGAGAASTPTATATSVPMTDAAAEVGAPDPANVDMTGNQIYGDFINTVKQGYQLADGNTVKLDNPYALAAVAATGKAESGYSPANANRSWSDPSASGQPGTAGGIMSWRGPRLEALYNFAGTNGEKQGAISPATQAKFFLQEDPNLIAALNKAGSVEDAQRLMNNAWAFRGYDQPGGEAARRLGLAKGFLPSFQTSGGAEVASLDPKAGVSASAPQAAAYVDPQVTTGARQPVPAPAAAPGVTASAPAPSAGPNNRTVAQALTAPPANGPIGVDPQLFDILSDPYISPGQSAVVRALIDSGMSEQQAVRERAAKLADPAYQADLRLKNLQANQIEHPQISPADQARLNLDKEKFATDSKANADRLLLDKDKFAADKENNALTPDLKEYNAYVKGEQAAGRQPLSQLDYQLAVKRAGANVTNNNVGGEGNKFFNTLDEKNAGIFSNLSDTGIQARSKLGQIDQLEKLLQASPTGALAALKQRAGEWGINTDGLSDLQAATALINQLVPQQRQPGSGSMSDQDLALFKQSLPRLINQPGGNATILNTMRGITNYQVQMGNIADNVANREITPAEGRQQIADLPNPLSNFQPPPAGKEDQGWNDLGDGVRIRRIEK